MHSAYFMDKGGFYYGCNDTVYHYYLIHMLIRPYRVMTHTKKSELRDIYNRMVKTNKESLLYKIKETKNAAKGLP